jgi:hypothetical protein
LGPQAGNTTKAAAFINQRPIGFMRIRICVRSRSRQGWAPNR